MFVGACTGLTAMAQSASSFELYSAPPCWVENFTHEDQSVSRVLVFSTVPGVSYTVETSHDLQQWTKDQTFYGLGQDIAISMIQTAAAPNPPPSAPPGTPVPVPMSFVSLLMRPASTGGLILSWRSLDHQETVEHHCASLTLGAEWNESVLYMNHFGSYHFSISHPLQQAVPKANATLATKDAAMVAAFEAHFEAMSQEVEDSVERSRLNPVVATPADPMSRKFYRIVADWGLDSDHDLSPDWLEFMAMLGLNGLQAITNVMINGETYQLVANPMGDSKAPNGAAAGTVQDADGDGIADVADANPASKYINWQRRAVRFAIMPVPVPNEPRAHDTRALQTNRKGQVLFRHSLWENGSHTPLSKGSFTWAHSIAMNEQGVIIGNASSAESLPYTGLCKWSSKTAAPAFISSTIDGNTVYPLQTEDHYFGGFSATHMFTDSQRFCAPALAVLPPEDASSPPATQWLDNTLWKTNANGQVTAETTDSGNHFVSDPADVWKHIDTEGKTSIGGKQISSQIDKLIPLPGNRQLALGGGSVDRKVFARIGNGDWSEETTLSGVYDLSESGIGCKKYNRCWLNSKNYDLKSVAPLVGQDWSTEGQLITMVDISPSGHLLLAKEQFPSTSLAAAHTQIGLAFPFEIEDTSPATGVDAESALCTADYTNPQGYQDQLWIMAPQGTWTNQQGTFPNSNEFILKSPLADGQFTMSFDNATATVTQITGNETTIEVSGTGTQTSDGKITFTMNQQPAVSYPIGIKSMKRRTVIVKLFKIKRRASDNTAPYDFDIQQLTNKLNDVYGKQINTYFLVKEAEINGGTAADGSPTTAFEGGEDGRISYGPLLTALFDAYPDAEADIRVMVTNTGLWGPEVQDVSGMGLASHNACVVDFSSVLPATLIDGADPYRVVAHEIGHIIFGEGHPDEVNAGQAKLPGTDYTKRLMCSGNNARAHSLLLVKKEWDLAEEWLKRVPDKRIFDSTGSIPDSY